MTGAPQRRLDNIAHARELLARAGIAFQPVNNGAALLVEHNGLRVEFTPGNGAWRVVGTTYEARGCKELIRFLTERPKPNARAGFWWYGGDAGHPEGLYRVVIIDGAQELENVLLPGCFGDLTVMPGRWARALNPLTGEAL